MKTFDRLANLLPHALALHWDSTVFVDRAAWAADPLDTPLTILEGDDELEDLANVREHLPRLAADRGLHQLLDTQTFQDVVGFELRRRPQATASDVAHAIDHYREFDDFFDPDAT